MATAEGRKARGPLTPPLSPEGRGKWSAVLLLSLAACSVPQAGQIGTMGRILFASGAAVYGIVMLWLLWALARRHRWVEPRGVLPVEEVRDRRLGFWLTVWVGVTAVILGGLVTASLSRPVRRVLRASARPHGADRRGGIAGGLQRLEGGAAGPGARARQRRAGAGDGGLLSLACSMCHRIREMTASASVAPDVTHLVSRPTIAAGT